MARIKSGDTVMVLSGRERGKSGKVMRVWPQEGHALVERLNLMTHYERRSQQHPSGGIVKRERPLPVSKLALVCGTCRRPARVRWERGPDGSKRRLCRRCQGSI
jgi:large subunit ribosomal protein L24